MAEIDVTTCKYYSTKEYISNNNGYTEYPDYCSCYADGHCLEHPNCYYKQLQQYKQLCEQKTVDNFDLIKQNEELKKLKYEILNKKSSEREYCKNCTLPAYSKVLDEIEEICKQPLCPVSCDYADIILQKIKEVKGNNDDQNEI